MSKGPPGRIRPLLHPAPPPRPPRILLARLHVRRVVPSNIAHRHAHAVRLPVLTPGVLVPGGRTRGSWKTYPRHSATALRAVL